MTSWPADRRRPRCTRDMLVRVQDRRAFLKRAAASLAAGGFVNLNPAAMGANEKVTLALIGGRNQGNGDALRAIKAGARFKTFCDLDPKVLEKTGADIAKAQGDKPGFEDDFRRVLDDKEIDAVMIATPDHWHARMAILACQAGKDVYVEKPLCQTIQEGQAIRDAARKHNRVVQVGTQRRSMEHRSEEHTSELQSLRHLVCRLLPEKKRAHKDGVLLPKEALAADAQRCVGCYV